MAEIHVNMKQLNKWKVYSDNVIAYDQIIQSKGKFFTDRPEIYTRWLDEYGIFYTLKGAEKEIRKANPAPRKRAAKKSTPKSFDQFTKRQLQDFITGCHNARDYGPEFTAACYALNSQTTAPRKTNPAKRPAPKKRAISRPSQVTKKAPSKRLVARRKVAAKKPVKGYFPNPVAFTTPGPSRKAHWDLPHLFPQPGGAYMVSFWNDKTKKWVPATLAYSMNEAKKWLDFQGYKKAVLLK